jgi:hypothetical protein
MKKILEWLKTAIAAIMAARKLYAVILVLLASLGYLGADKLSTEPVEVSESKIEAVKQVVSAKTECNRQIQAHLDRHHGGS